MTARAAVSSASGRWWSASDELSPARSIGDEAAHTVLLVGRSEQRRELQPFEFETDGQVCVVSSIDRTLRCSQRQRRTLRIAAGEFHRAVVGVAVGEFIDEPAEKGLLGRNEVAAEDDAF